jgi:predicted AAA+ superfamily ATPase
MNTDGRKRGRNTFTLTEQKVLDFLNANQGSYYSVKEISQIIDLSGHHLYGILSLLCQACGIYKFKTGKCYYYGRALDAIVINTFV